MPGFNINQAEPEFFFVGAIFLLAMPEILLYNEANDTIF